MDDKCKELLEKHDKLLKHHDDLFWGDKDPKGNPGLVHDMSDIKELVEAHIKGCKADRKEIRLWFMSILGVLITGFILYLATRT